MPLIRRMRELGPRRFAGKAIAVAANQIWRRDTLFWIRRSTAPFAYPQRKLLGIAPIDKENIARFAGEKVYDPDLFLKRVEGGLDGFFHCDRDGNKLRVYHWLCVGKDYFEPYLNWTFRIKPNEAYSFDGFATSESRGGIGPVQSYAFTFDYLRQRGVDSVYAVVDRDNPPAWRFHLHLGFEIVSCLRIDRVLRRAVRVRELDAAPFITPEIRAAIEKYSVKRQRRKATKPAPARPPAEIRAALEALSEQLPD